GRVSIIRLFPQPGCQGVNLMRCRYAVVFGLMLCLSLGERLLAAQSAPLPAASTESGKSEALNASSGNLYVKVELNEAVKVSKLKPGDVLEGKLSRDVYSGERDLFPAGSRVRLTVDKLEQRRRVPNDHWPWVINVFTPRHENYPTFHSASVFVPDGREVPL